MKQRSSTRIFKARSVITHDTVRGWPLCLAGSHFVYTCYPVLHLNFKKNAQVQVMKKFTKSCHFVSELHVRIASQVGSSKKPDALRHAPIIRNGLQRSYTYSKQRVQKLAQSGGRHLIAAAPCLECLNGKHHALLSTRAYQCLAAPLFHTSIGSKHRHV